MPISLYPFSPSCRFSCLFSSSSYFSSPQLVHPFFVKRGLKSDISLCTDLILSYFVNGEISISLSLFKLLFKTNMALVNSTVKNLSISGSSEKILLIYRLLWISGLRPDNFTFPYTLKACADLAIFDGRSIHTQILKSGFSLNVYVANSIIDMYSKFGSFQPARQVFDEMADRNLVSWNLIISCYRLNGFPNTAVELCCSMRYESVVLDKVSMKIILPACGQLRALRLGKSMHAHMITSGLSSDVALTTAVMDMYGKCGSLNTAERLFDEISCKDVVSWNALISGYSQIGKPKMVIELFQKMRVAGTSPSIVTVLLVLQACADLGILQFGDKIHGYVIKLSLSLDVSVQTLLVEMYSKCGKLCSASCVFNGISEGTVNSWSAIIYGLGMHGYGKASLMGFFGMLKRGIDPDDVCFLIILSTCSHTGLVSEGCNVFNYMVKHFAIQPKMEHYASMVDLLGRAGFIDEAFKFIRLMPTEPGISVWGALLGACKIYGDFEIGGVFEECLVESGCKTAGYYKLLLSIYASKGRWDDVARIRGLMEKREVERTSGYSLIEISS